MRKIRAKTTFYDSRYGEMVTGQVEKVPNDFAKDMVERGYAEFADEVQDFEIVQDVKYPKGFLDKSIPQGFAHLDILRENDIKTFRDLANIKNYPNIKNVGPSRAEEIKEDFKKALNKVRE